MSEKRIKYICYYDDISSDVQRNYVLSATNKLNYIFASCNKMGVGVDIISASECVAPTLQFHKSEKKYQGENTLQLFATIGGHKFALTRVLNRWVVLLQLFFYLLCHTKRGECCVVYHSLGYVNLLRVLKKIKSLKFIGEIEEIYHHVDCHTPNGLKKGELKFIEKCDGYIFPTELLNSRYNKYSKPFVIIYGTYEVMPKLVERCDDGRIHVVYAGTFDVRKGGVAAAAAAAKYLPPNYHVHICGFGSAEDIVSIKKVIAENQADTHAKLTYDGLKKGEEYIRFIQSCHVGLSTQDPSAAFNSTSFPSKILSYMCNGLAVVSIDIAAIRQSAIGECIHYYDKQEPQQIAATILSCNYDWDGRGAISKLGADFVNNFKVLLDEFI